MGILPPLQGPRQHLQPLFAVAVAVKGLSLGLSLPQVVSSSYCCSGPNFHSWKLFSLTPPQSNERDAQNGDFP